MPPMVQAVNWLIRVGLPARPQPVGHDPLRAGGAVVKESQMAMGDKIKHAGEQAAGKVKEGAGKVTGDKGLETEGKTDQAVADVKQAGDKAKDALDT